jgi:hypothetical protein
MGGGWGGRVWGELLPNKCFSAKLLRELLKPVADYGEILI